MKQDSINMALLGNCTTDYISDAIREECKKYGMTAVIYNSPYNRYNQEILNDSSGFYASNPELTVIFLEGRLLFPEWLDYKILTGGSDKKAAQIQSVFNSLASMIEKIHLNSSTKIILNNFKVPYHSPLGILDGKYYPGIRNMIALLNLKLDEWACNKDYIYVFDYCGLCAQYGNANAEDPKMYYIAKNTVSFPFMNVLAGEYMRYILPLKAMTKKCLVLDLDNTLWGGIAGEDGISGIKLDITGTGMSFHDFQKEILNLHHKGIILAVNSKNNIEDAVEIIEKHPHMLLRKSHFSSLKINWQDKVENLKEIAGELNIGIDSMVFFDDSPVEREYVKSMLPGVKVLDVPADTSKYVNALQNIVEFELLKITDEDINRNLMYEANRKRLESLQSFKNAEDYLSSLEIKVIIEYADEFSIPRMAQLTQKTNQFNMTTKRYSQVDIENMAGSGKHLVLSCKVMDKFGDNGIAGVCIAEIEDTCAYIDTFLLSCRVLGRNIEYAFINKIVDTLRDTGIDIVYSQYIKTEKNRANENFYFQAGFTKDSVNGNETLYSLSRENKLKIIDYIEIYFAQE